MKKSIITLTGFPGSGKSSTADGVAKALGYQRFSSGDFMRAMAKKRGVSLDELQQIAKRDPSVDYDIDEAVRSAGEKERLVIDSRTAFHWIPNSFKVFLKTDPHVGAERTFNHIQSEGRLGQSASSVEDVYEKMLLRIESECERYKTKYGIDYRDESNFDLVVDTGKYPLEEVVRTIVEEYKKKN